jgi:hypothetical protein
VVHASEGPFRVLYKPGLLAPGLGRTIAVDLPCSPSALGRVEGRVEIRLRSVITRCAWTRTCHSPFPSQSSCEGRGPALGHPRPFSQG